MTFAIQQLEHDMLSLPTEARALLAERLLESLDSTEEDKAHQLWIQEIKKRLDDFNSGRVKFLSGDEALSYLNRA